MRELDKVLDADEKVLWEGSPNFLPFVFGSSVVTTIFGIFWMLFLIYFAIGFSSGFIFLTPHFWMGLILVVGIPIYTLLLYKNVHYAITDKRVIIQKGVIGRDFEIVDFDKITNAEVNVGVFDKLFSKSSGSILISTAGSFTYGRHGPVAKPYTLSNISNPYDVFKFFKKVAHDVKTDIEYPNKYRPKVNPGYKTKYKSK